MLMIAMVGDGMLVGDQPDRRKMIGQSLIVTGYAGALLFAIYGCVQFRRCRSPKNGYCDSCGYDLTGNVSGICPECGRRVSNQERRILR